METALAGDAKDQGRNVVARTSADPETRKAPRLASTGPRGYAMWGTFLVFAWDDEIGEELEACHIIPCDAEGVIVGCHKPAIDCRCRPIMDTEEPRVWLHNEIH